MLMILVFLADLKDLSFSCTFSLQVGLITRLLHYMVTIVVCTGNRLLQWTVNGELRVGFFTKKPVTSGEELTFNYQFEFYG